MKKSEGQEESNYDIDLPKYGVFENALLFIEHNGFLIVTHYKLTQFQNVLSIELIFYGISILLRLIQLSNESEAIEVIFSGK